MEKDMLTTDSVMSSQPDPAKIQTVIAARPGVVREALRATLALSARFEVRAMASGGLSTLSLVLKYKPALLIIDSGLLEDEIAMLLGQLKQKQPQLHCLVVTETRRQQQTLLALGADTVVLRSEPTERLVEALDNLTTTR